MDGERSVMLNERMSGFFPISLELVSKNESRVRNGKRKVH